MTYRKTENFIACRYVCKSFMYKLFVFPNMVLVKTEYSNAVNACYTFQLLMSFCCLLYMIFSFSVVVLMWYMWIK